MKNKDQTKTINHSGGHYPYFAYILATLLLVFWTLPLLAQERPADSGRGDGITTDRRKPTTGTRQPETGMRQPTTDHLPAGEQRNTTPGTEKSAEKNQNGDDPASGDKDETGKKIPVLEQKQIPESESLWQLIKKGGWTMLGLGLISTLIVAFSLERLFFFRRQDVSTKGYYDRVAHALREGGPEGMEREIEEDDRLLSRILRSGLAEREAGLAQVEKAIENTATVELGKLERGLNLLSNMGNLAPLLGFFGTVVGMRNSFLQFVVKASPTAKDLAGGIEEALITTAAGLLIAIPTYLVFNLFIYFIDSVTIELERCTAALLARLK